MSKFTSSFACIPFIFTHFIIVIIVLTDVNFIQVQAESPTDGCLASLDLSEISTPRHIAIIGNPGSGKSTLLNGIFCRPVFQSGLSFGGGLTQHTSSHTEGLVTLYDTPGLNDILHRSDAAAQIQNLLDMRETPISFVFVMTLQSGRVRVEDVTTLHIILDAVNSDDGLIDNYAIVLNMLSPREYDTLMSDNGNKIRTQITGNERRTKYWGYIPLDDNIVSVDNAVLKLPFDVLKMIISAPVTKPERHNTRYIDIRNYDERLEDDRSKLKQREEELEGVIEKQKEQIKRSLESLGLDKQGIWVIDKLQGLTESLSEMDLSMIRDQLLYILLVLGFIIILIYITKSSIQIPISVFHQFLCVIPDRHSRIPWSDHDEKEPVDDDQESEGEKEEEEEEEEEEHSEDDGNSGHGKESAFHGNTQVNNFTYENSDRYEIEQSTEKGDRERTVLEECVPMEIDTEPTENTDESSFNSSDQYHETKWQTNPSPHYSKFDKVLERKE